MIIHLIRHTTPDIDLGLCYGQTDLDLAETFEQESTAVLNKLRPNYDAVITSPLQRCSKLADKIAAKQRMVDNRLMEYNFGDWELKPWSEFKTADTQAWMDNFVDQPAPNGDSMISMKSRVDDFFTDLLSKDYQHVAVVSHSGVQRLLHGHILSTPMTHMFRLQLEFGAVLEIKVDQQSGLQTIKHL